MNTTIFAAVIGLCGVMLGSVLAFVSSYFSNKRETRLRIIEKIFDRRIKAHEDILKFPQFLRTTVSLNSLDSNGNVLTYPAILLSKNAIEQFKGMYYDTLNPNMYWISKNVLKELNYIRDYIENLSMLVSNINPKHYPEIGLLIKTDIINFASQLEDTIAIFFEKDIYLLKVNRGKEHHKLEREESIRRLHSSLLYKNWSKIESFKS